MSFFHKKKASTKANAANVHMTEAEAALAQSDFNIDKILDIQNKFTGGTALLVPGRIFIREGMLWKVCRKGPKKRQFFLFNDILVYGSVVAGRYSNQHVLPLADMVVSGDPSYQPETNTTFNMDSLDEQLDIHNAFQISHADKSFHVFSLSQADKANWLANLQKHINKVALVGGNQTVAPRAVWVPDSQSKECMICRQKFSAFNRKHHCRQCGRVVCSSCSPHRIIIDPHSDSKPERACSECVKDTSTPVKSKGSPELNPKSQPAAAVAAQVVSNIVRQNSANGQSPRRQTEESSPRQRRPSTDTEDSDDSESEVDTPPFKKKPTPTPRRAQSESSKLGASTTAAAATSSSGPPQRPPPFASSSSVRRPPPPFASSSSVRRPPPPNPNSVPPVSPSPPMSSSLLLKEFPKPKPRTRKQDETVSSPSEVGAKEEGESKVAAPSEVGAKEEGESKVAAPSDEPQPTPPPRKRKKAKMKQQIEQQLQVELQEQAFSGGSPETSVPVCAEEVREGGSEEEEDKGEEREEDEGKREEKVEGSESEVWEAEKDDGVQVVEAIGVGEEGGDEIVEAEIVTEPVEQEGEEGEEEDEREGEEETEGGGPRRRIKHLEQDDGATSEDKATPTDSTQNQEKGTPTEEEATPTNYQQLLANRNTNTAAEAETGQEEESGHPTGSGQEENEQQSGHESGHPTDSGQEENEQQSGHESTSLPGDTAEDGLPVKKPRGRRQKFKQAES